MTRQPCYRYLLDEAIARRATVEFLSRHGHDVKDVHDLGLAGKADSEVWTAAQQTNRVIITTNTKDFVPFLNRDGTGPPIVHVVQAGPNGLLYNPDRLEAFRQTLPAMAADGSLRPGSVTVIDKQGHFKEAGYPPPPGEPVRNPRARAPLDMPVQEAGRVEQASRASGASPDEPAPRSRAGRLAHQSDERDRHLDLGRET